MSDRRREARQRATAASARSAAPDSRVIIQAVARAVSTPNVTLLGFVVDTTNIPNDEFKDVDDNLIGRVAYSAAAAPGRLIKARETLTETPSCSVRKTARSSSRTEAIKVRL
jgi:hypothetical protein